MRLTAVITTLSEPTALRIAYTPSIASIISQHHLSLNSGLGCLLRVGVSKNGTPMTFVCFCGQILNLASVPWWVQHFLCSVPGSNISDRIYMEIICALRGGEEIERTFG